MSTIRYKDIDFRVPCTIKKAKASKGEPTEPSSIHILKSVSGQFRGGRLTAILGPSGSAKTTLLNLLAGRQSAESVPGATLSGEFVLDGTPIRPTEVRGNFAYVMAHDALYATITPRESFRFALKLSGEAFETSDAEAVVTELLGRLHLTDCADTVIGNLLIKGLSSGEKKRVAVGMEMINKPNIFFLDEPTSGLDSHSAMILVELLKGISREDKTVVMAVHQPSSELFAMFDDVVFMCQGRVVFQGPVEGVSEYFSAKGYVCPVDANPADFVMFLLQTLSPQEILALCQVPGEAAIQSEGDIVVASRSNRKNPLFRTQIVELGKREWKNFFRDIGALKARVNVAVILTLIFSFVYFQVGKGTSDTSISISHQGAVTLLAVNAMFSNSQIMMLSFPMERPVFLREFSAGWYGVSAYFLSKCLVEFPVVFVQVCLSTLIAYFIMGLTGTFFGLVYPLFLVSVASASIALLIACAASDARRAIELSPIVFVPQVFVSGFFVPIQSITWVIRWLAYISPLRYAVSMVYINEFKQFVPAGTTMLENNLIDENLEFLYAILLVVVMVAFRGFAMLALSARAKQVY